MKNVSKCHEIFGRTLTLNVTFVNIVFYITVRQINRAWVKGWKWEKV